MKFHSEEEMRQYTEKELISELTDLLGGENVSAISEVPYATGRTDLVLAKISDQYLHRRTSELGIKEYIDNERYLQVFLQLHNRDEVTEEYFMDVGAHSKRIKKSALEWLKNHGFVHSTEDSRIRTAPYFRRHITKTCAVEFKLSRWKRALSQAYRAKSYSDIQFVALDEARIDAALDNLERFEEYNIGLISVDKTAGVDIQYKPESSKPYSPLNRWKINEHSLKSIASP